MNPFQAELLTKRYGDKTALDRLTLELPRESVTGLIGRNGSGKTTLIRTIVGLTLPDQGTARTFGSDVAAIGEAELSRIGAVFQSNHHLSWMTVAGQLEFASAYHSHWDHSRQKRLMEVLELAPKDRVGNLSPGNAQKLAVLLAICPRPDLLLLDEPVSALDPIAREELLRFLLEMVREDDTTILISSHVLIDIERVVDRVVCLDRGRLTHESSLDDLLEGFEEWLVTSSAPLNGALTNSFPEDWILEQRCVGRQAQLLIRTGTQGSERRHGFAQTYGVDIQVRPANLERLFPHLVRANAQ
jgi:ABC-2 type transport system ATP-binding protein